MSKDEWRMERARQAGSRATVDCRSACPLRVLALLTALVCAKFIAWLMIGCHWLESECLSALIHSLPRIHWRRFRSRSQNRHNMTQHQRLLLLYPSTSAALFIPNYSLDTALVSHKPSQRKNLRQENQISSPFSFLFQRYLVFGSRPTEFLKKYGFRRLWIRLFRRRWLPHWRWHVLGCHWG